MNPSFHLCFLFSRPTKSSPLSLKPAVLGKGESINNSRYESLMNCQILLTIKMCKKIRIWTPDAS